MAYSTEFVELVRKIVQDELNQRDTTVIAQVSTVNDDNSVNLYLAPDFNTEVTNIKNASIYHLDQGDWVILFKIKNNLSNAFVIARIGG